jgi:RND family efflux transporter MFP subunit
MRVVKKLPQFASGTIAQVEKSRFGYARFIHFLFVALIVLSCPIQAAELDCMVKPEMYIELSSPIAGVLEKLYVNKGDHVSKGQPVAQLEASVERAKVNQAKFEVANTSELNSKKTQLAFAKRTQARYRGINHQTSISQLEKDKADTEVILAEAELKKALEDHKAAELTLEVAKTQLALKTIKSPIDGIVIDRYAMIGESVNDRAIMKLAQVDPLRVELIAPTEYFGLIQKGMEVEIRPERPLDKVFKATVTVVDQLIDPASGSFSVRMALPNPEDTLVGGVNCLAIFGFDAPAIASLPSIRIKESKIEASQPVDMSGVKGEPVP